MLTRVLRTHLAPYKRLLLITIALQAVQTTAALLLPHLNANIINNGVLPGDQAYIRREGAIMLGVALVQGVFAAAAVYYGARIAMGFGADLRASLFHRVTSFSTREVGAFGAPSLITRITNDVTQVQLLVVMTTTMALGAPITIVVGTIMALREDVGLSVVLEFVNAHGGTIEIVDGEYSGAHFRIRMPVLSATSPVGNQAHAA